MDNKTEETIDEDLILWRRVTAPNTDGLPLEIVNAPDQLRRPTVVVLSGTPGDTPQEVNSYLKWVDMLLGRTGMKDKSVQLLGVQYPMESGAVQLFVHEHMLPLVTGEDGNRLPLKEAKRNLRNLHFVCHSNGGRKLKAIRECFTAELEKMGFDADERKALNRQVFAISIASATPMREEAEADAPFTVLHVLNQGDWMVLSTVRENHQLLQRLMAERRERSPSNVRYPEEGYTREDTGVPAGHPFQMMISELSPQQWLLSVNRLLPRHKVNEHGRFDVPELTGRYPRGDSMEHRFSEHVKLGYPVGEYESASDDPQENRMLAQYGMLMPTALAFALRNAVDNAVRNGQEGTRFTPLPGIKRLLEVKEKKELSFAMAKENAIGAYAKLPQLAEAIGYNRRINKALNGMKPDSAERE